MVNVCADGAAVVLQFSAMIIWPLFEQSARLALIAPALFLISCGWWMNYVPAAQPKGFASGKKKILGGLHKLYEAHFDNFLTPPQPHVRFFFNLSFSCTFFFSCHFILLIFLSIYRDFFLFISIIFNFLYVPVDFSSLYFAPFSRFLPIYLPYYVDFSPAFLIFVIF